MVLPGKFNFLRYSNPVGTCHGMSLQEMDIQQKQTNQFSKSIKNSLSMILNQYKGSVKRYCNKNNLFFEWQPRFYENIIKEEESLNNIRHYIKNNLLNWSTDSNNPNNNSTNKVKSP